MTGIAVIGGAIAIASIAKYLVVAGALLLVGWLLALAVRASKRSEHSAVSAPPPALPSSQYQQLVELPSGDADTPVETKRAACAVFSAWLRQIPTAPRDGTDLIQHVEKKTRLVGRLTTDLEGRRLKWCSRPAPGKRTLSSAPAHVTKFDPWNPPADLVERSRYVCTCSTCKGEGRVTCSQCGGASRTTCRSCAGSGKYYGTTANGAQRVLNCKGCRGKGNVSCADCSRGLVSCGTCEKAKKIECWLEVDESSRHDTQVEPDGEATKAFVWGVDGVVASQQQIERDARVVDVVSSRGALQPSDLPTSVPQDWIDANWAQLQPRIENGERVRRQEFSLLELSSTFVTYQVMGDAQTVAFEGRRLLAPPPHDAAPFLRRAQILKRVKIAVALLPLAALTAYLVRGSYFVSDRVAPLLAGIVTMAAIAALLAYGTVWSSTLGRRSSRRWAAAAAAPIAICACLVIVAEPSTTRASDYIARGELSHAESELDALGDPSSPELAPLWAQVHLRRVKEARTCTKALEAGAKIPPQRPEYARVVQHADALAIEAATRALKEGHDSDASTALDCASAATRATLETKKLSAQIKMATSRRCTTSKDWECAYESIKAAERFHSSPDAGAAMLALNHLVQEEVDANIRAAASEKSTSHRVAYQTTALNLWLGRLSTAAQEPKAIVDLRASLKRDEQLLAREQEAERKRQEAEEKRRIAAALAEEKKAAAAEARRKRQEEAAERRRAYAPLVCGDGSLSPSCVCGGSWRGCCSHHGGVSGCYGQ